jgi:anti-sigma B factor antagonist
VVDTGSTGMAYGVGGLVDLTLSSRTVGVCTVVEVGGEIDVYTAPKLREQLVTLVQAGHYHLVVDLEGVDFLDSTGLGVLVGGLKRVRAHDGTLRLICTQERVLKIFRITGLTKVFPIYTSVADATAE